MSNIKIVILILLMCLPNVYIMANNDCKGAINNIRKKRTSEQQYLMGIIYKNGICVKKDLMQAFRYFSKSNNNKYPLAKFELAEMYYWGDGIEKDYKKAYNLYKKIMVDNYRDSIIKTKLGTMFLLGQGVEENLTKAKELYEDGSIGNYSPALYNLGIMYMSGLGVDKNITKAIEYLEKSSADNHMKAQYYLASLLAIQDKEKNRDRIFELLVRSAINGLSIAQVFLGNAFISGEDMKKDMKKAKYWIQKAKDQNSTKAKKLWDKYELWKY